MSLKGWKSFDKEFFGGAWTAPDRAAVGMRGALLAQNVRFFGSEVATTYGLGVAFSLSGYGANSTFYSMFNWMSELGNTLVWVAITGAGAPTLQGVNIAANPPTLISIGSLPAGAEAYVHAAAGPRLYTSEWQVNPFGGLQNTSAKGVVTSSTNGLLTGLVLDTILPGPFHDSPGAPTEPSGGIITAGLHKVGYRILTRHGFLGRPSPDSGTSARPTTQSWAPQTITSSGSKNLNWTFTPGSNWPADAIQIQIVMTPVSNPNRLFLVPGAVANVTGGSNTAVNISWSIDDATLISTAIECTNTLDLLTDSPDGSLAAFFPYVVAHVGNRMCYVANQLSAAGAFLSSVVYVSDPVNYESLTADQHFLQVPQELPITTVAGINGAFYIFGPHWTFVTQDNGLTPVNWQAPQIVDGRRGALYPNCVEVATSGKYAWVADRGGLYYFDGSYAPLPISYWQSDLWRNIGFPSPYFTIKDDPARHRVIVLCQPLSGVLQLYIWDYTKGMDADSVRFSTRLLPLNASQWANSSIEMVDNTLNAYTGPTRTSELWLTPQVISSGTVYFQREKNPGDSNLYRDTAASDSAIHSIYETNILPATFGSLLAPASVAEEGILAHQGCNVRIVGAGTVTIQAFSFDKATSVTLNDNATGNSINLSSPSQAGRQFARGYLIGPNGFIYHFEQNALDSNFDLSQLTMYYSKYSAHL